MDYTVNVISLDFVNAYLVKAKEGFLLIDTGLPNHRERLEKELLSAGCLPDTLKLIILTHGDWDHTGNASRFGKNTTSKSPCIPATSARWKMAYS